MSNFNTKFEVLQVWITDLPQQYTTNPMESEQLLTDVLEVIHPAHGRLLSGLPVEMERRVRERTAILTQANAVLQVQMEVRKTAHRTLQQSYDELERQLQERTADITRLNLLLREQIQAYKQTQTREHEQRILMQALRDTVVTMSSTLDLDKVLDNILETLGRVTPYDGANVLFVESDLVHVVRQRGYVEKGEEQAWLKQRIPITKLAFLQHMMNLGTPLAVSDTANSPLGMGFPGSEWIHSNVIAPIRLKDEILGFLSLDSATTGFFTSVDAERLQVFADQAAIAIQNARLYDRAKNAAVMEERTRLANELHDTISQTLWSMSLIAERLPSIWELDVEEGRRSLATLHQLALSALTEMRSLLLELGPSIVMDTKLGDLIRQQTDSLSVRTGLIFSVQIGSQYPVPPEVQMTLYRVTQEILNNIVHHASAHHVEIRFESRVEYLELMIQDDGRGFDPDHIASGHLGLSIMRDRLQSIGGTLETTSQMGQGTQIKVIWIAPRDQAVLE